LIAASTDGTLEIVRRYTVPVFETDRPGYSPYFTRLC
jgi:hypothetical protein